MKELGLDAHRERELVYALADVFDELVENAPQRDERLRDFKYAAVLREAEGQMASLPAREVRAGWRSAIRELIELTLALTPESVAAVDARFRLRGLPTLSRVRAVFLRLIPKVLRRGTIRTEDEYFLVKERVVGEPDDLVSSEERAILECLMYEYEERQALPPNTRMDGTSANDG